VIARTSVTTSHQNWPSFSTPGNSSALQCKQSLLKQLHPPASQLGIRTLTRHNGAISVRHCTELSDCEAQTVRTAHPAHVCNHGITDLQAVQETIWNSSRKSKLLTSLQQDRHTYVDFQRKGHRQRAAAATKTNVLVNDLAEAQWRPVQRLDVQACPPSHCK
jgi:hypothetical protein